MNANGMTERLRPSFVPRQQFGADLHTRRAEFKRMVCEFARSHRQFCLTSRERQSCDSIIRGASLSFDGMELLCVLAARDERDPTTLEKQIGGAVLQRALTPSPMCPFEASELEQESNGPLNLAQLKAHQEKTAVRWWHVIETGRTQIYATVRMVNSALVHVGKLS